MRRRRSLTLTLTLTLTLICEETQEAQDRLNVSQRLVKAWQETLTLTRTLTLTLTLALTLTLTLTLTPAMRCGEGIPSCIARNQRRYQEEGGLTLTLTLTLMEGIEEGGAADDQASDANDTQP